MTPEDKTSKTAAGSDLAAVFVLQRMQTRPEFLAAARGDVARRAGFVLQALDRGDGAAPRVGFTCSKKVGNAVARNRAKRRLREAARLEIPALARPGWSYVLIGRREKTAALPFSQLRADLAAALAEVHP